MSYNLATKSPKKKFDVPQATKSSLWRQLTKGYPRNYSKWLMKYSLSSESAQAFMKVLENRDIDVKLYLSPMKILSTVELEDNLYNIKEILMYFNDIIKGHSSGSDELSIYTISKEKNRTIKFIEKFLQPEIIVHSFSPIKFNNKRYIDNEELIEVREFLGHLDEKPELNGYFCFVTTAKLLDIIMFLRATLEVIADYSEEVEFCLKDWTYNIIDLLYYKYEDLVPILKYYTAYPMAKFLNNELPPKPKGFSSSSILFHGKLKRFLKVRMLKQHSNKTNVKVASLWQGFLQGIKRGCREVPKNFVLNSYKKHSVSMIKDGYKHEKNFSTLFKVLLNKVTKRFNYVDKLYQPSTSAHFDSSMKQGGAEGLLLRKILGLTDDANILDSYFGYKQFSNKLQGMKYDQKSGKVIRFYGPIIEQRYIQTLRENLFKQFNQRPKFDRDRFLSTIKIPYDLKQQDVEWDIVENKLYDIFGSEMDEYTPHNLDELYAYKNRNGIASVMTYGIPEPLKVRIITKGQSELYWHSKSMQKYMWKHLKNNFPAFKLLAEPLTKEHLIKLDFDTNVLQEKFNNMFEFDLYVSGDYSAATDNLKTYYTTIAFESFLSRMEFGRDDTYVKNLLRLVIYPSEIKYPTWTKIDPVQQTCGQLMGSPLSFPILCTVNYISYLCSMIIYLKNITPYEQIDYNLLLKLQLVLVNGDDICFKTNEAHYKIWKECVDEVGFALSLGKNYVHDKFLTINSILFYKEKDDWTEVPYLNVGLMMAKSKLKTREETEILPISALYNKVMEGATNKIRAHTRFLFYNKERLKIFSRNGNFNLFLPQHLGGLGFDTHHGIAFEITNFQKKLAVYLYYRLTNNIIKAEKFKKIFNFHKISEEDQYIIDYKLDTKETDEVIITGFKEDKVEPGWEPLENLLVPEDRNFLIISNRYLLKDDVKLVTEYKKETIKSYRKVMKLVGSYSIDVTNDDLLEIIQNTLYYQKVETK